VAFAAILHPDWEYRAFVAPLAGGATVPLVLPGTNGAWSTSWSADGAWVYVGARPLSEDPARGLYRALPDGSQATELAFGVSQQGGVAAHPSASQQGLVALGGGGIRVADLDTLSVTTLSTARAGREEYGPAWSPDGTRIAFVSRHGPNDRGSNEPLTFEIVVVNADGSGRETLLSFEFEDYPCDTFLAWAPSGTRLAYNRCAVAADGGIHLHVLDLASGQSVAITSGSSFDGSPSWVP